MGSRAVALPISPRLTHNCGKESKLRPARAVSAARPCRGSDPEITRERQMTGFAAVLRWTALVMLSCGVPFGIFVGRNNIRAFRRETLRDLARLSSFASLPTRAPLFIPPLELVKYNS